MTNFIWCRCKRKPSEEAPEVSDLRTLLRTAPLFAQHKFKLFIAGLCVLYVSAAIASPPLFQKKIIDDALPHKDIRLAVTVMVLFSAVMFLRMCLWYGGQCIIMYIRERAVFKLRSNLFAKVQELCMRFHHRYSPGFLYDRMIGTASTSISTFFTAFFNTVLLYIGSGIISIIVCFKLNAPMTLWLLATSILYAIASKYYSRTMKKLSMEYNLKVNEFAGLLTDLLRGVKTIKVFTMEEQVTHKFDERMWPLQMRYIDLNKEQMRLGFVTEAMGYLVYAFVMTAGAKQVIAHDMQLGTLLAFVGYQTSLVGMMSNFASLATSYSTAVSGLRQVFEVLDEKPSVIERLGAIEPKAPQGHITMENLHFGYENKPVIKGLDLHVEPGQSVALVGPSGSGKTTLINLLLRLYDPDDGCIQLDGKDIRDLTISGYRSLFGVVLQDPFLFNDTIYNNLVAAKPEATEVEVRRALENAQAWDFVCELENGWHFKVGESGQMLSGGQRQRIALARCILTNPKIMILDEATSALDNQSERLVQKALEDMMQDRTTFVIAHRLSTVRNVDRILVLQEGKIVQDGSFDKLSRTPGVFRDLHLASFCEPLVLTPDA